MQEWALGCPSASEQKARLHGDEDVSMDLAHLDRYLLEGTPPKATVVKELLAGRRDLPGAAPFYAGLQMLGHKAPDLTLIALRLVFAGKKVDDASVIRMRRLVERARAKGVDAQNAIEAYYREVES